MTDFRGLLSRTLARVACCLFVGGASAVSLPSGYDWQDLGGSSPGSGTVEVAVPSGFGWLWWCTTYVAYPGPPECYEWGGTSGEGQTVEALDMPWHDGDEANIAGSNTWYWVPLYVEPPDGSASAPEPSEGDLSKLLLGLGLVVSMALGFVGGQQR